MADVEAENNYRCNEVTAASQVVKSCAHLCQNFSPQLAPKKLPPVPNFSRAEICTNIRTHTNFQGGQNILRKYVISHFSPPHNIHLVSCGLICFYRFYESWDIQATDYMFILDSLPTSHWQHSFKPCLYSDQQAKPPTFQNMTHVIVIMTRLWSLALSLSL